MASTRTGLRIIACGLTAAAAKDISLVTFDGAKETSHVWKEQNDPVMGGLSTGTFTLKDGVGVFDGDVQDVPFLKAPGFIKATTTDSTPFPDISSCTSLVITAKAAGQYDGFRLSFGTAHAPGGKTHAYGYKVRFVANSEEFTPVTLPLTSFTDFWDDATGNPVKTCQDDKKLCPDKTTLQNLKTISVWGEGVKGKAHLEIKSISASGCSNTPEPSLAGLGKGRMCPAYPKSAKECPYKNITDVEFEPVCVQRSELAELQQRRCMKGEKAPYYKDSQGVFRCACCGAALFLPSVQFDEVPAANWPWPSFHSHDSLPLNGTDGLPNVCHRGPGFGITQRNATPDLGLFAKGEVGCARCGAHLGDYFDTDTPNSGLDHYCINGVCMEPPGGKAGEVCAPTTSTTFTV